MCKTCQRKPQKKQSILDDEKRDNEEEEDERDIFFRTARDTEISALINRSKNLFKKPDIGVVSAPEKAKEEEETVIGVEFSSAVERKRALENSSSSGVKDEDEDDQYVELFQDMLFKRFCTPTAPGRDPMFSEDKLLEIFTSSSVDGNVAKSVARLLPKGRRADLTEFTNFVCKFKGSERLKDVLTLDDVAKDKNTNTKKTSGVIRKSQSAKSMLDNLQRSKKFGI